MSRRFPFRDVFAPSQRQHQESASHPPLSRKPTLGGGAGAFVGAPSPTPSAYFRSPTDEIVPVISSVKVSAAGSSVPRQTRNPVAPANRPVPPVIGPETT